MRVGNYVIRVSGSWNGSTEGDIRCIDGLKISNQAVCLHLKGDKPDTFHSGFSFRLLADVNVPMFQKGLEKVRAAALAAIAKSKKTKTKSESNVK